MEQAVVIGIKSTLIIIFLCLLSGCFKDPEGVVLYDDIKSYSSLDSLNEKYSFSPIVAQRTNDEDIKATAAVTDYPFF